MSDSQPTLEALLAAGVHFGHQTRRWNPKMRRFIFAERNGIHIIDLQKTLRQLEIAQKLVRDVVLRGDSVLFVCTKAQVAGIVKQEADRCGAMYITERWLGGLLTNFATIQRSLGRLRDLEAMATDGRYDTLSKKEIARNEKERRKLTKNLEGIRGMSRLPDAIFIVDTKKEQIAVDEARKLKIPIIGIVDTNADPDQVDFVIPGNDDALRSIRLFAGAIANAVISGRDMKQSVDAEAARDTTDEAGANGDDARRAARPVRRREAAPASA